MNVEEHKRALRESLEEIRTAIQTGIEKRQRTIGIFCSLASVDMLEIYLHEQGLIDPGTNLKHDFFASMEKAKRKLKVNFENKELLLKLMSELEKRRNILVYGKKQPRNRIEGYIDAFNQIKELLAEMGVEFE